MIPGGATVGYENGRAGASGVPIIESVTIGTSTTGYLDHDAGGTPEVFTTGAGVEEYYVLDGQVGSPVALIRTNGQQGSAYSYDPYPGGAGT